MSDTILKSTEARLLQSLRALGDADRAEQEKRYQKSRWDHWGVALPKMDVSDQGDAWRSHPGTKRWSLCRRLWREPVWDLKIVAGRILCAKVNRA